MITKEIDFNPSLEVESEYDQFSGSDVGLSVARINEINSFLLQVKLIIQDTPDNFIVHTTRPKNEQTLLRLGFASRHVGAEICSLTHKNYHKGPEANTSRSGAKNGSVWIFGKRIEGIEIYIKIHLVAENKFSKCVCISFHESDYPITYPYR